MVRSRPFLRRVLVAAFVATLVAGTLSCADTPTAPRAAPWVRTTPEALSLLPLDTVTVTARLERPDGTVLTNRVIGWEALDAAVAHVTAEGHVTASAYPGPEVRTTSIVVTSAGAYPDTVPVEVRPWTVGRVTASDSAVTLAPGDSVTLTAILESHDGAALTAREVLWLSSDPAVANVSAAGQVRAQPYAGALERNVLVTVWSEGVADSVLVTVPPMPPSEVLVGPDSLTLVPGEFASLTAVVRAATGETLTDLPLTWTSTDTTVARVNAEGVVTAVFYAGADPRTASIIVTIGEIADTASVEVRPLTLASVTIAPDDGSLLPGATVQLDAALRDAAGFFLTGHPLDWHSADTTIARVDANGLVTAAPYGGSDTRTVMVTATSGTVADTVTLTVLPHAVAWVTATPEALSVRPFDTVTVAAALQALDLTPLTGRGLTWSSLDTAIASVNPTGLVTAGAYTGPAVRTTAILVSSGAAADTVPVEVLPLAVERVIAAPEAATLSPGDSIALTLTLESASGVALTARDVLWLSSDTAVVTVSAEGTATARPYAGALERIVSIVVYGEGVADTVTITVTPLVATSLEVAPDSASIIPGEQVPFTATVRDASGTVLTESVVTWTSGDTTIARVNADGVVTAVFYVGPDERTVTLVAALGEDGVADTAFVRVRPLASDSIAIFPTTQTLHVDDTVQLDAVVRDSAGTFLTGRVLMWASSNPLIATVTEGGLVTALAAGTVTITATDGDATGEAEITVLAIVTDVRVTPRLSTLWIGRTQPFTVVLRDTNGTVLEGRDVTWTSSDPTRATVDEAGVVTAIAEGLVSITASSEGRSAFASVDVFAEPTAAITITYDDSWRGVLENAFPVMEDLRLRANVGWITSVDWSNVMVPEELRTLQSSGWTIVSHSMTHPYLTQLTLDSARKELIGSRNRVDSLGFDPRVFIAPYLDHNDAVLGEVAAAGYAYARCCTQDVWTTDSLSAWPIPEGSRYRLAGVDVTDYEGQSTSYNFRTADGRERLRLLLLDVVARGQFVDVFFHDVQPPDVPDLRLTLEMIAQFRPYLITYGMLP